MKLRAKSRRRLMVLLGAAVGTMALGSGAYGALKVYRNHVWQEERAKGLAAFAAHDAPAAVRELGPYVQRHAADVPALETFAAALEQVPGGDALNRGRALGTYERLVTLCPENLAYRLALTRLYAEAWTWTMPANLEAIRSADELVARFGGQPAARDAVAEALRVKIASLLRLKKRNEAQSAIAQLKAAPTVGVEAEQHDARAAAALARLAEQESDDTAAEALYRFALQRDPTLSAVKNNLAMMLLRSGGNLAEAELLARAAVVEQASTAAFHDTLGRVLSARRHYSEAATEIAQAVDLDGTNPEWPVSQAELLIDAGEAHKALDILTRASSMEKFAAGGPALRTRVEEARRRAITQNGGS